MMQCSITALFGKHAASSETFLLFHFFPSANRRCVISLSIKQLFTEVDVNSSSYEVNIGHCSPILRLIIVLAYIKLESQP